MIMSRNLFDFSMDPSLSPPQAAPFTQRYDGAFVWRHDNGIMNCGGDAETSCQYWPVGAPAAENKALVLPRTFKDGGSVYLGSGLLWIGGGRPDTTLNYNRQHYKFEAGSFTRLTPDMPADLVLFCPIHLGGNRQEFFI